MDMNLLFAILIALVPVLLTVIFARLYNVVHGIITFLVMGYLLVFCLNMFGDKLGDGILTHTNTTCALYVAIDGLVVGLLSGVGFIANILSQSYGKYIVLAVWVVIFVVSQIIACVLRKRRVEKIRLLRRQVKRY